MKKLLWLLPVVWLVVTLLCVNAQAGQKTLTFAWTQEIGADFAGWKLYKSTSPNVAVIPANLAATIPYATQQAEYTSDQMLSSPDGQEVRYYFVLTAFDTSGNESGKSNEVSEIIDFLAPNVPIQFRIRITGN